MKSWADIFICMPKSFQTSFIWPVSFVPLLCPLKVKIKVSGTERSHRSRGQSRDVKKCKRKMRALWKPVLQELRTKPPIVIAHPLAQNSFVASPWMGSGLGWLERDFGVVGELCHVGVRFKALEALIFMAPSLLPCIFYVPRFPSGTMWWSVPKPFIVTFKDTVEGQKTAHNTGHMGLVWQLLAWGRCVLRLIFLPFRRNLMENCSNYISTFFSKIVTPLAKQNLWAKYYDIIYMKWIKKVFEEVVGWISFDPNHSKSIYNI